MNIFIKIGLFLLFSIGVGVIVYNNKSYIYDKIKQFLSGTTPVASGTTPVASGTTPVSSGTTTAASNITTASSGTTTTAASNTTTAASNTTTATSNTTTAASNTTTAASSTTTVASNTSPEPPSTCSAKPGSRYCPDLPGTCQPILRQGGVEFKGVFCDTHDSNCRIQRSECEGECEREPTCVGYSYLDHSGGAAAVCMVIGPGVSQGIHVSDTSTWMHGRGRSGSDLYWTGSTPAQMGGDTITGSGGGDPSYICSVVEGRN